MLKGKHTQTSCPSAIVATILGNQFEVGFKTVNSTHFITSDFDD
jgi:predicted permease